MIRILHTADWHLGKKLEHISRLEEQKAAMMEIVDIVERENPDLVIVAGDLFDQFNPPVEAQDLLYKTLKRLTNEGRRPVLAIAGNHDSPDRIASVDPLARYNGIFFSGYPHTKIPAIATDWGWQVANTDAGLLEFRWDKLDYPVRVLHTAFPNELRLKTYLGDQDGHNLATFLSAHWQQLITDHCNSPGVNILTAHLFASPPREKYEEEDGERATLSIGGAQVVFPEYFPAQINYAALGHLHRPHAISSATPHICYSGSPLAYSFAEAGQQKIVNLVELEPGKPARVMPIPLQAGKQLIKYNAPSLSDALDFLGKVPDSIVDLTVRVSEYLDAPDRKALFNLNPNVFIRPISDQVQQQLTRPDTRYASGNIEDHFQQYFLESEKMAPSAEMMNLFREILGTETNP